MSSRSYLGKRKRYGHPGFKSSKRRRFSGRYTAQMRSRGRLPAVRRARNVALANLRTGGLLGIETKYLDVTVANVTVSVASNASGGTCAPTAGCTGCLTAPAQGDGAQDRDGKKIVVKSCLVQGQLTVASQAAQTAADSIPVCYIALVQDTQTNAVTTSSEDVFTNFVGNANMNAQPFRNMSNTARFKVVKSWTRRLIMPSLTGQGATNTIEQTGFTVPFDISWTGLMPVNFKATGSTADVANVVDNSLHLIAYSSGGVTVRLDAGVRIRFVG